MEFFISIIINLFVEISNKIHTSLTVSTSKTVRVCPKILIIRKDRHIVSIKMQNHLAC